MPIQILQDQQREIRLIEFSGTVRREELGALSRLYIDRDFYRFGDREVVFFKPDASLAAIDVEDISHLADSYIEAIRMRDDQTAVLSAWVMGDHVRADIRLWWEFTRGHVQMREPRTVVDNIEAALIALGLSPDWAEDLQAHRGFRRFDSAGPAQT
ncbi:hypothetical protein [uncultured Maricaulis sp.]|uniref:hypothetical protein n=1 Tax=uncultured Maricaulis sp. TaxID=174710 RepID=UPI0030D860BF|tara:strand:+ start:3114 stop:3581 length:468 start_codon:yes stop_codon:yes gene_type:complete